jgi:hypothetical protein
LKVNWNHVGIKHDDSGIYNLAPRQTMNIINTHAGEDEDIFCSIEFLSDNSIKVTTRSNEDKFKRK